MNRIYVSFALIGLLAVQAYAGPVDVRTAEGVARTFLQKGHRAPARGQAPEALTLAYTDADVQTDVNRFYVFNREAGSGFVIVSADDRAREVLGYADSGSFDPENLPENLAAWLDTYRDALDNLPEQVRAKAAAESTLPSSVEPLLGGIAYGQTAPYNSLCPKYNIFSRCVTGCAATSMAQVMRYYRYPKQGIGSCSYTTNTLKLAVEADFGATTYDWDHMLERYETGAYTTEESAAVATLMFHCGAAMRMDYNRASGTTDFDMLDAFVKTFGYDGSTIRLCYRDYYDTPAWEELLRTELSQGRPVVYNGQSSGGGHSFVCDGYDADGFFHINWGWNGQSDGYFALNVLQPETEGVGGGAGGYNFGQSAVVGIQPLTEGAENTQKADLRLLFMDCNQASISGIVQANISFALLNFGVADFKENLYCLLENESDSYTFDMGTVTVKSSRAIGLTQTVKSEHFKQGTYRMRLVTKPDDQSEWIPVPVPSYHPAYLTVTKEDDTTTFSLTDAPQALPQVTDFEVEGELVKGKEGIFRLTVSNTGAELNQAVCLLMEVGEQQMMLGVEGVYLRDGESKTLTFKSILNIAPGTYNVYPALERSMLSPLFLSDEPYRIQVLSESSSLDASPADAAGVLVRTDGQQWRVESAAQIVSVRVIDLSGRVVAECHASAADGHVDVDHASLPVGTYLVQVSTTAGTVVCKQAK